MFSLYFLCWYAPVVICYFAWPLLRRRRAYVVVAAILCLTPMLDRLPVTGIGVFPLIYSIPHYLFLVITDEDLQISVSRLVFGFLSLALPLATFVGLVAWQLANKFVSPLPVAGNASGADGNLRRSGTGEDARSPKALASRRYPWLRRLLQRAFVLVLLYVAVIACIMFWDLAIRVITKIMSL